MRHTRNRQLFKLTGHKHWTETYNIPMWESRKWTRWLDKSFKWHSEAVSSNFWSNWRKSCVSFDYKTSLPNDVGMATKYLPTKERN